MKTRLTASTRILNLDADPSHRLGVLKYTYTTIIVIIAITTITDIAIITIIITRVTVQIQERCLTEAKVAALAGSFKNIKKSFF